MSQTEMGKKAREWLTKEGYAVETKSQPGFSVFYAVTRPNEAPPKLTVTQVAGEDKLVITTGVRLEDGEGSSLSTLSPAARRSLIRDLSWILHGRGLAYEMDERDGALNALTYSTMIFEDGLSKDRLMQALHELLGNHALVTMRIGEALATAGASSPAVVVASPVSAPRKHGNSVPANAFYQGCPKCGSAIRPGTRFCGACGNALPGA